LPPRCGSKRTTSSGVVRGAALGRWGGGSARTSTATGEGWFGAGRAAEGVIGLRATFVPDSARFVAREGVVGLRATFVPDSARFVAREGAVGSRATFVPDGARFLHPGRPRHQPDTRSLTRAVRRSRAGVRPTSTPAGKGRVGGAWRGTFSPSRPAHGSVWGEACLLGTLLPASWPLGRPVGGNAPPPPGAPRGRPPTPSPAQCEARRSGGVVNQAD
jgi:hypothetical protein